VSKKLKVEIKKVKPRNYFPPRNGGSMDNREKRLRTRSKVNDREIRYSKGEE
jgi:hypothetical protein